MKVSKRSVEGMDPDSLQRWMHHQKPPGLPKDKDPMVSQSDAIYWYQCGDLTCNDEYMGKTPGPLVKDTKST